MSASKTTRIQLPTPLPTAEEMPLEEWLSDPDSIILNTGHWSGVCIAITVRDMPLLDRAFGDRWGWQVFYHRDYRMWLVRLQRRNPATNKTDQIQIGKLWLPDAKEIDHINRHPLDNRRSNIRPATKAQNAANRRKPSSNTGMIGVHDWTKKSGYFARVASNGKRYHKFVSYRNRPKVQALDEALAWRDEITMKLHGEFAVLNTA